MHFLQVKKGYFLSITMQLNNPRATIFTLWKEVYVYLKIPTAQESVFHLKKPRHKAGANGYGEYTTITAIAGEPTVVAD